MQNVFRINWYFARAWHKQQQRMFLWNPSSNGIQFPAEHLKIFNITLCNIIKGNNLDKQLI